MTPEPRTSTVLPAVTTPARPHAGLLLDRIESKILAEGLSDKEIQALRTRSIWSRLDAADRMRWADAAQMAGEADTALAVLESLARETPDNASFWNRLLELLSLLGRGSALSRVLAAARHHLGPDFGSDQPWLDVPGGLADEDRDLAAAAAPFEELHQRQDAVNRFLALFSGRKDSFARQWANRAEGRSGYVPVKSAMSRADVEEHLAGKMTYGIYLMQQDARVKTAVIDADLRPRFRDKPLSAEEKGQVRRESAWMVSRVRELSLVHDARPLLEVSGAKGFHFWYFFNPAANAATVRSVLDSIGREVGGDLQVFGLEIFPKQDRLTGKGFGNLVKLPLGIHRMTGKRSYFPECKNRSIDAQLAFLETVKTVDPKRFVVDSSRPGAEIVVHPRLAPWVETYPELHRLQTRCPPLGQIMALCMERKELSVREEKVFYQTLGFLDRGREYLHHLLGHVPEYNPHMVDYRLSRLRGTPLGCKRIHGLLSFAGPYCRFARPNDYLTPLLHVDGWQAEAPPLSGKAEDLKSALSGLRTAMVQVERFLEG